jgi:hypothetical protein
MSLHIRLRSAGCRVLLLIAAGLLPSYPAHHAAATDKPSLSTVAPGEISSAVAERVKEKPKAAPQIVSDAINSRSDGCAHSAELTTAAIASLPQPSPSRLVADIVYRAVRACPDSVLEIVPAAVAAAPASAAEEIVAAAVSAVPDPYKLVNSPEKGKIADFKSGGDFKGTGEFKDASDHKPSTGHGAGREMTLADAIVKSAFGARDGLDYDALAMAADNAIKFGLDRAIAALEDPRVLFGVGDAGLTNFENEPRRAVSGGAPPTPTPVSTPPPASK